MLPDYTKNNSIYKKKQLHKNFGEKESMLDNIINKKSLKTGVVPQNAL